MPTWPLARLPAVHGEDKVSTVMKTIGLDFGTESVRGVLMDVESGEEIAAAISEYEHGVIDGKYHDPDDYLHSMDSVLRELGPSDAIGVDATACSVLPCKADGTPLSRLSDNPLSLVKIWKNHDAQPQADRLNELALQRGESWLSRYGRISSEWFFPKVLHTLEEAPAVYREAGRFIEKADWIVWQLTGRETRNACAAGYKAMWHKRDGFPSDSFFQSLHPSMAGFVQEKTGSSILPVGAPAGRAGNYGDALVAVGTVDAHAAVPAAGITEPGAMLLVMGTSLCHLTLAGKEVQVLGMCGAVEDGILPGYFGYESGQAAVGDMFAWFSQQFNLPHRGSGEPGSLVALDWWNGSRELQRADLSGVLVGLTLDTTPEEIYRALVESAAFGTRRIIEAYETAGLPIAELRASGGLPERNPFIMQVFADVTGRRIRIARTSQASAVGSAMLAAMAAGASPHNMGGVGLQEYVPNSTTTKSYDELYSIYTDLHEKFSDGVIMAKLKGGQLTP